MFRIWPSSAAGAASELAASELTASELAASELAAVLEEPPPQPASMVSAIPVAVNRANVFFM